MLLSKTFTNYIDVKGTWASTRTLNKNNKQAELAKSFAIANKPLLAESMCGSRSGSGGSKTKFGSVSIDQNSDL